MDRYSNPSGALGVHRFHVWPAGSDSYSHEELSENWDKEDAIIGVPAEGVAWPPSEGVDGGIYREVKKLQHEREPIGFVSHWFRPSTDVPLSILDDAGWHICDGSTLADSDHDFPGIAGNVTLPDLRNKFILGANSSKTIGTAGVNHESANANTAAGAPGPQGKGGTNALDLTDEQLPFHVHVANFLWAKVVQTTITFFGWLNLNNPNGLVDGPGVIPANTPGFGATYSEPAGGRSDGLGGFDSVPFDNRPNYIGLIPIIKVKYITTI